MKVFFKKECELQEQMQHMTKADGVCLCTTRTTAVSAYGQREGAARRAKTGDGCKPVWPKA